MPNDVSYVMHAHLKYYELIVVSLQGGGIFYMYAHFKMMTDIYTKCC